MPWKQIIDESGSGMQTTFISALLEMDRVAEQIAGRELH
jgi:hypothetical protein